MHILLTVLIIIAGSASFAARQDRLPLGIEVPGDVGLYQPVMLWYTIRNNSTAPRVLELGYDRIGNFTFVLERPDGSVQKGTPLLRPTDHGARPRTLTLAAGESYRQHVVLNEWLRFDQAGRYTLRIELTGHTAQAVSISPSAWQVWIRPIDPAKIEARSKALLSALIPITRYDANVNAAVAELTWMRHPVAVPYLEEAIAAEVSPSLFDALVEIGTAEARNAVTRLTRHQTAWVANGAKSALGRMK